MNSKNATTKTRSGTTKATKNVGRNRPLAVLLTEVEIAAILAAADRTVNGLGVVNRSRPSIRACYRGMNKLQDALRRAHLARQQNLEEWR